MVVVAAFNLSLSISHMPLHQYLFIFHIYLTLSTHPLIHNLCITRVPPSLYLHLTRSFTSTVNPAPSHNLSYGTHTTKHSTLNLHSSCCNTSRFLLAARHTTTAAGVANAALECGVCVRVCYQQQGWCGMSGGGAGGCYMLPFLLSSVSLKWES